MSYFIKANLAPDQLGDIEILPCGVCSIPQSATPEFADRRSEVATGGVFGRDRAGPHRAQ